SLNDAQIAREVFATNDVIRRYTGEPAVLFRPPGGRLSWGAYRALRSCGMDTVLWTDDPKDYLNPGKPDPMFQQLLLKRLMDHIRPGGIILLHDGIEDTVAILPEFIKRLRAKGYEVGTVTELLLAQQHHEADGQIAAVPPAARPAQKTGKGAGRRLHA
ncbi:MAG: polysaccharide deacetylase family protein, partial [Armatimonadota bacterium]|nr:polysaccharide deacetylase family protein [Armatimonadota bacterium]